MTYQTKTKKYIVQNLFSDMKPFVLSKQNMTKVLRAEPIVLHSANKNQKVHRPEPIFWHACFAWCQLRVMNVAESLSLSLLNEAFVLWTQTMVLLLRWVNGGRVVKTFTRPLHGCSARWHNVPSLLRLSYQNPHPKPLLDIEINICCFISADLVREVLKLTPFIDFVFLFVFVFLFFCLLCFWGFFCGFFKSIDYSHN